MKRYVTIMAIEEWPSIPGHAGESKTWTANRKAVSDNGSHWLVRKDGWFQKWQWRPVKGMFVVLKEVKGD